MACAIFATIYLIIGSLLIYKRNNPNLTKRTPWLVNITHWANLGEILLVLPTATEIVEEKKFSLMAWQLISCGIMICHFLIFFPYILRGYRIYEIFHLSHTANFSEKITRTTQKFLIRFLGLLMFPVLMICAFIVAYKEIAYYFPVAEKSNTKVQSTVASCIYITNCFFEELLFVFLVYKLRFIQDKYNMTKELIAVAIIWYMSPLFSTFVNSDRKFWLLTIVIRNLSLCIISSIVPIIYSFKKDIFEEPLTIDMLGSLEIILESSKTLRYFEKYLRTSCQGQYILEFYQKCECQLNDYGSSYSSINGYIESGSLPSEIESSRLDSKQKVAKARNAALAYLNKKFYNEFLKSPECEELREAIRKEEIITDRVRKTSIHRNFYIATTHLDTKTFNRTSKTFEKIVLA